VHELVVLWTGGRGGVLDKPKTVLLDDRGVVDSVVEEKLDLRVSALSHSIMFSTHVFLTLYRLEVLGLVPVPLAEAREGPDGVSRAT